MRRDVEGALSFFEQRSRAKMVDQRRRRNKEVEQRPNEYLRQVRTWERVFGEEKRKPWKAGERPARDGSWPESRA